MRPIAKRLENHLLAFLHTEAEATDRPGLLVTVSGGLDSTALLHLLVATRDRHRRPIVAGHVNHAVRPDADREEARLRALCAHLQIPFRAERLALATHGAAGGASEAELRKQRYRILRRMEREGDVRCWIVLAHQRDDQAETVLLNLLRGSGLAGLAGMRPRRGIFLRPLLDVPRVTLRRYLEEIGAEWVEDPTNRDLRFARNRLRHQILPALEQEIRPGARGVIARASRHLRTVLGALDAEAARCFSECRLPAPPGEVLLDARRLRTYHVGLVAQTLRHAVAAVRGNLLDIPSSIWDAMQTVHARGGGAHFTIQPDMMVELTARVVRIAPARGSAVPPSLVLLPVSGQVGFPPAGGARTRLIRRSRLRARLRIHGLSHLQAFDADAVRQPARIRLPRAGDRVRIGVPSGSRKLADLLSERGVPRWLRGSQPVIEDADGILWVPGIRRAERARIEQRTKRIWLVRWFGSLPVDAAPAGGETRQ